MENEGNEDLHGVVLRAAFKNLLVNNPQQIQVITSDGVRLCFNQHLFLLFSPLLRFLHSSLPPEWKVQGEPLTIILPDTQASIVLRLADLLTNGSTSKMGTRESQEVVIAATKLGISMPNLEGADGTKFDRKGFPSTTSDNAVSVNMTSNEKNNLVDSIMHNSDVTVPEASVIIKEEPDTTEETITTEEVSKPTDSSPNYHELEEQSTQSHISPGTSSPEVPSSPSPKVSNAQPPRVPNAPTPSVSSDPLPTLPSAPPLSVPSAPPPIVPSAPPHSVPSAPLANTSDVSAAESVKEFQCQKCQKAFNNLIHLKSHYCLHFKMILKKTFNNLSPDNKCTDCPKQPVFASSDRLLLHIGVHHHKIDYILKAKGITLTGRNNLDLQVPKSDMKDAFDQKSSVTVMPPGTPVRDISIPTTTGVYTPSISSNSAPRAIASNLNSDPDIIPARTNSVSIHNNVPGYKTSLSDDVETSAQESAETRLNCDLKCEVCNQEQKSINLLEQHCCRHFMKELRDQYTSLMDGGKCSICGNIFKQQMNLLMHIGCKHGKINEILQQKGFAALPCPVINNTSAAMQRQLMKIKQEKAEYNGDGNLNSDLEASLDFKTVPEELSSENIAMPTSDVPTTLDEILRNYKITTAASRQP
jgi:hypothetical protein